MEREFGQVGSFVLEKQCSNISIDPNLIGPRDIPRLSRILSGLVSRFGPDRARRVYVEMNNLLTEADEAAAEETEDEGKVDEAEVEDDRKDEREIPRLFSSEGSRISDKHKTGMTIMDVSKTSRDIEDG
jgi:hypothetical protein